MNTISISQLKTNPASAILAASEYPVAVSNRNKTTAYLIGKELYERLITYMENYLDKKAVTETDFSKRKEFDKIAQELSI